MNKLCCELNSYPLKLTDCTCDIKMCRVCIDTYQSNPSKWFSTFNSIADYHVEVSPECPGIKRYKEYQK